jgi:hypothetical protein
MFALAALALSAFEDVPLTNDYVANVHNYALHAVRTLFPDAPQFGEYPQITAAAVEAGANDAVNIRLTTILLEGIEFNITIEQAPRGTHYVTAVAGIEVANAPANEYKWELPESLSERTKGELIVHLSQPPNRFNGEITTVLSYRTQVGNIQQNHHAIFADDEGTVYSVVFHSQGQDISVSVFRTLQEGPGGGGVPGGGGFGGARRHARGAHPHLHLRRPRPHK